MAQAEKQCTRTSDQNAARLKAAAFSVTAIAPLQVSLMASDPIK